MDNREAVNWLINISADIGKVEHSDLWHYEQALTEIKDMLESAQPDVPDTNVGDTISRQFEEIVVRYPSVDLRNYTEYKGKPYFSIRYKENDEDYIGYGTYNPEVLSRYLRDYFMPPVQPEQRWIPCCERLPEDCEDVLITYTHSFELTCPQETAKLLKGVKTVSGNPIDPKVVWEVPFADYIAFYDVDEKRWFSPTDNPEPFPDEIKVIAWMPLPEPYKGGEKDG